MFEVLQYLQCRSRANYISTCTIAYRLHLIH